MENDGTNENQVETNKTTEESQQLPFWRHWTLIKYFYLLKDNPKFRYLWLGALISIIGDLFSFIANIKLINMYIPNQSSIAVAFYFMCWSVSAVISPIAGVIADRYDRRKVMLFADLCRCLGALNYLWIRWEWAVYLIFPIEIFQSVMTGIFDPSRSALLPNLIDNPDQLIVANSLDGSTWSIAAAIGSSIGGIVVAFLGTDANYIFDSITYAISFICILQLFRFNIKKDNYGELKDEKEEKVENKIEEKSIEEKSEIETEINVEKEIDKKEDIEEIEKQLIIENPDEKEIENHQILDGTIEEEVKTILPKSIFLMLKEFLVFFYQNKDTFILCFMRGSLSSVWGALAIPHVQYVEREGLIGNNGSLTLGIYYSVIGFGAFLGPLIAQRYCDQNSPLSMRLWYLIGLFLQFFGSVLSGATFHVIWMLIFGAFLRPIGENIAFMLGTTILQRSSPDYIRGRVFSFSGALVTLGQSVFAVAAGILLDTFHVNLYIVIYIISALNFLFFIFWSVYLAIFYYKWRTGRVSKVFEYNGE